MKTDITIICGTTGSGKTALALRLAKEIPTSIISADSRQVYQGFDIVTGKDIPPGLIKTGDYYTDGHTRIFGLDLIPLGGSMSAGEFAVYAKKVIESESRQGRQVVVVGGTGFYLKAITDPGSFAQIPPNVKLRAELSHRNVDELRGFLSVIDPDRLARMNQSDAANPRRLIRAIEVASSMVTPFHRDTVSPSYSWIGLRLPLGELQEKIRARVLDRLAQGALEEVKNLIGQYHDETLPVYTTLGVKPIAAFLRDEINHDQLVETWTREEMQYAKRQLTWFRKQPGIIWYDQGEYEKKEEPARHH